MIGALRAPFPPFDPRTTRGKLSLVNWRGVGRGGRATSPGLGRDCPPGSGTAEPGGESQLEVPPRLLFGFERPRHAPAVFLSSALLRGSLFQRKAPVKVAGRGAEGGRGNFSQNSSVCFGVLSVCNPRAAAEPEGQPKSGLKEAEKSSNTETIPRTRASEARRVLVFPGSRSSALQVLRCVGEGALGSSHLSWARTDYQRPTRAHVADTRGKLRGSGGGWTFLRTPRPGVSRCRARVWPPALESGSLAAARSTLPTPGGAVCQTWSPQREAAAPFHSKN